MTAKFANVVKKTFEKLPIDIPGWKVLKQSEILKLLREQSENAARASLESKYHYEYDDKL